MKSASASTGAVEYQTFEEELKTQGWFCWTNVGTSMMPLLRQGRDLMVIRRKDSARCRCHDAVLYKRVNANGTSSYILHRILKVRKDGTYWIVGDNCGYGEVVRDEQILGILTAIVRDGKREIPVTNFWYRLYVHLWCDAYPLRLILIRLRNRLRGMSSSMLRKFAAEMCHAEWGARLVRLVKGAVVGEFDVREGKGRKK